MENSFDEIIFQRIYEKCAKNWNCVSKSISLLPYSEVTKKSFMLRYIEKYSGVKQFIAEILSRNIFLCLDISENNEEECYFKMLEKIDGLPKLLPESLTLIIYKAIIGLSEEKSKS